jgi:hypothetical protein
MSFKEDGKFVGYKEINGKKVPHYLAETEVTLTNTKTGKEYNSDKEADDDIKNPNTDTVKDHIRRDVKITVPKLVMGSGTSK